LNLFLIKVKCEVVRFRKEDWPRLVDAEVASTLPAVQGAQRHLFRFCEFPGASFPGPVNFPIFDR